jgi:hypothetical protein
MNRRLLLILTLCLSLSFLVTLTDAHIPIVPNDGTTLATATEVIDPWKSWFYYSELDAGVPHYYTFEATAGERIRFMLNVPIPEVDRGVLPTLVLMGPGVTNQGTPAGFLEIPVGAGVMVFEPSPHLEFEGFTPLAQYEVVDLNMSAPSTGTYYIAVYDASTGGRYAFVTGYVEAYSLLEWITVPSAAMLILIWSGQSLLVLLLLNLLPLILGLIFIVLKHRSVLSRENLLMLLGTVGGLLFLGSSLSFFVQTIYALLQASYNWTAIMSLVFMIAPLLLGVAVLRIVLSDDWKNIMKNKIALVVLGLVAPFLWTGLYFGPILVVLTGLVSFRQ